MYLLMSQSLLPVCLEGLQCIRVLNQKPIVENLFTAFFVTYNKRQMTLMWFLWPLSNHPGCSNKMPGWLKQHIYFSQICRLEV